MEHLQTRKRLTLHSNTGPLGRFNRHFQPERQNVNGKRITAKHVRWRRPRNLNFFLRRGNQHNRITNQLINGILLEKNHGKIQDN